VACKANIRAVFLLEQKYRYYFSKTPEMRDLKNSVYLGPIWQIVWIIG